MLHRCKQHFFPVILLSLLDWCCVIAEPINNYNALKSHLTNGARVTYFFNTSSCQSVSNQREEELPVFGGEINFFLTTAANSPSESLIFNNDKYVAGTDTRGQLNEDVASIYVVNSTVMILYDQSGFFANNSNGIKMVICTWNSGNDAISFRASNPSVSTKLNSYSDVRRSATEGEPVRFVVSMKGCTCRPGDNCGEGFVGGKIQDFKFGSNGTLSFSAAMTLFYLIPTAPYYYRQMLIGQVQPNNTTSVRLSYLNATTWEEQNGVIVDCPVSSTKGHADFYAYKI